MPGVVVEATDSAGDRRRPRARVMPTSIQPGGKRLLPIGEFSAVTMCNRASEWDRSGSYRQDFRQRMAATVRLTSMTTVDGFGNCLGQAELASAWSRLGPPLVRR